MKYVYKLILINFNGVYLYYNKYLLKLIRIFNY